MRDHHKDELAAPEAGGEDGLAAPAAQAQPRRCEAPPRPPSARVEIHPADGDVLAARIWTA